MKNALAVMALAVFGLVPLGSAACDYSDAMKSAAATPAPAATAPAPQATTAATADKAVAPAKQAPQRAKTPAADQKVAASTIK
jgi:hypothetical protein